MIHCYQTHSITELKLSNSVFVRGIDKKTITIPKDSLFCVFIDIVKACSDLETLSNEPVIDA